MRSIEIYRVVQTGTWGALYHLPLCSAEASLCVAIFIGMPSGNLCEGQRPFTQTTRVEILCTNYKTIKFEVVKCRPDTNYIQVQIS